LSIIINIIIISIITTGIIIMVTEKYQMKNKNQRQIDIIVINLQIVHLPKQKMDVLM